MSLLHTRTVDAFTAVQPSAAIGEIQTAKHGWTFQERTMPVEVTIGDEAGIKASVRNQGTLPAVLRTTMHLIDPDGNTVDTVSWEEEFAAGQTIWYEKWFTLSSGGSWQVIIDLEFPSSVGSIYLDRAVLGITATGEEQEVRPIFTLRNALVGFGVIAVSVILLDVLKKGDKYG